MLDQTALQIAFQHVGGQSEEIEAVGVFDDLLS